MISRHTRWQFMNSIFNNNFQMIFYFTLLVAWWIGIGIGIGFEFGAASPTTSHKL